MKKSSIIILCLSAAGGAGAKKTKTTTTATPTVTTVAHTATTTGTLTSFTIISTRKSIMIDVMYPQEVANMQIRKRIQQL